MRHPPQDVLILFNSLVLHLNAAILNQDGKLMDVTQLGCLLS